MNINRPAVVTAPAGPALAAPPLAAADAPLRAPRSLLKAQALPLLRLIHQARGQGRPGDNAFFVLSAGDAYVQALAPFDRNAIILEAVSAEYQPDLWLRLGAGKAKLLARLGFSAPGAASTNYSRDFEIRDDTDLQHGARVSGVVLGRVYGVEGPSATTAFLSLPRRRREQPWRTISGHAVRSPD